MTTVADYMTPGPHTIGREQSLVAAKQMMQTMGVVRPPTQAVLDRLASVPVDIEPRFVTAEQLLAQ